MLLNPLNRKRKTITIKFMKAIKIAKPGPPGVLKIYETAKPDLGDDEVLIEVYAAGVNRPDVMQRQGKYPAPPGAPADIPGLEVAGIIAAVGAKVSRWQAGQKVCALVPGGGYAEFAVADQGSCLPIPASLSFIEAASLPETVFTVWQNVFETARLKKGENFLVHGGTSGIGVMAIQMARAYGARVFTTAGTAEKCSFCEQELGASQAVNYKLEDFEHTIKEKMDVILDMIGGDYTPKNINLLNVRGRLVFINAMKEKIVELDVLKVMSKQVVITGNTLRPQSLHFKAKLAQNIVEHIWPLVEKGLIKPYIFKTFPLSQAVEAHELMESSNHIGKIILEVRGS